ncbi:MAG TPA: hypothetical protein V6C72_08360 [Chroococcales cyanobacterium]
MSKVFTKPLFEKQQFACQIIEQALLKNRLAHALLLTGCAFDDKWQLATELAMFLNCQNSDKWQEGACHERQSKCQNCRWISENKHPMAFLSLTGEDKKSGKISVEKARNLGHELAKSSQYTRVVVIEDATQEIFHRPAANALLKTIEDPGPATVFLLFAGRQDDVLATIVSRCQVVPLRGWEERVSPLTAAWSDDVWISAIKEEESVPEVTALKEFLHRQADPKARPAVINALELSKRMQALLSDELGAQQLIDLVVSLEAARLGKRTVAESASALYLKNLLSLAENAKMQVDHYVSPKAALESFTLSWWQLRQ